MNRLKGLYVPLRIEEKLALWFFLPMSFLTFYFIGKDGYPNGARERFFITFVIMLIYVFVQIKYPQKKATQVFRDIGPFLFCIAIYTNLHDLVYLVHPTNIDDKLIAIDQKLIGCQLSIVALQYRPPLLIRWLEINYSLFFYYPVLLGLVLYLKKKQNEYRTFLVTIMFTFFTGYFLYLIFPAVGPKYYFHKLFANPAFFNWRAEENMYRFFQISENVRRDAFPSLHNSVTLLVLCFAFKYEKVLFYLLLPFAISLMIATVYLGHHYLIDVLAGWVLTAIAFCFFPRLAGPSPWLTPSRALHHNLRLKKAQQQYAVQVSDTTMLNKEI